MDISFGIFDAWKHSEGCGFMLLSVDTYREDELMFALLGFSYDKDEKMLGIDLFWKYFEFKLGKPKL
jgi:hypothetical protein